MKSEKRAVLIAGPTASGKSALALEKAAALDGVIVNADSMQIYQVLNILSARPLLEDLVAADHRLYGFVPPSQRYSTGEWLAAVERLMADPSLAGRPLIFTGGTGLYFDALINGVADVPKVPQAAVDAIEAEVAHLDREGRARLLRAQDPMMAERIREPDRQRVVRALSVLAVTGKSLAQWQDEGQKGLLGAFDLERIVINPDRELLRRRIDQRFRQMLDAGAVEEVKALMALNLDARLPAMKAIGVREISAWLEGRIGEDEAIEAAVTATRQYAKRQRTWFRNRMADWTWLGNPADGDDERADGDDLAGTQRSD